MIPEHLKKRFDALRGALKDPDEQVRQLASKSLEQVEALSDLDLLIENFKRGDKTAQIRSIYAFGRIRHDRSLTALVFALKMEDEDVRTAAIRAIGEQGHAKAVGPLLEILPNETPTCQIAILDILPNFKDPEIVNVLRTMIRSKNVDVVEAAIKATGRLGDRAVEDALMIILQKGPTRLRRAAAEALGVLSV